MTVDFHSHTCESDGTLRPAELVAAMRKRGVSIFSITDHDTLQAYESIGDIEGARIIPGIEINTTWRGGEVHILGYGLPLDESPLTATLEKNRTERRSRVERMVAGLSKAGYAITYDDVVAESGGGDSLGRPRCQSVGAGEIRQRRRVGVSLAARARRPRLRAFSLYNAV